METILQARDGRQASVRYFGQKFAISFSGRHIYLIDPYNGGSKMCIDFDDNVTSYDMFCKSLSETYMFCLTEAGPLYAINVNFSTNSRSPDGDFDRMKPTERQQIWKISAKCIILGISSENSTAWMLECIGDSHKMLSCYRINCSASEIRLEMIWTCDYNCHSSVYHNRDDATFLREIRTFIVVSSSTWEEQTNDTNISYASDRHVRTSDSLFVCMFGMSTNLERQSVVVTCLPDGAIHWFAGHLRPGIPKIPINVLWNMEEAVVDIHCVHLSLPTKNPKMNSEGVDCLVVVGKNGSIVVFGVPRCPYGIKIQVCCHISSSCASGENLLFSTSDGIYTFSLAVALKDSKLNEIITITPKLHSRHRLTAFKLCPENKDEDDVATLACLEDGRVVRIALPPLSESKSCGQEKTERMQDVKRQLVSMEAISKHHKSIQEIHEVLNRDFSKLCMASNTFHAFKKSDLTSDEFKAGIFLSVRSEARVEYKCVSAQMQLYEVTATFQFDNKLTEELSCSYAVSLTPSSFTPEFPRSLLKSLPLSEGAPHTGTRETRECSVSFICTITSDVLPLTVLSFLVFEFPSLDNLAPLMVPFKKFEAGILKFTSTPRSCRPGGHLISRTNDLCSIINFKKQKDSFPAQTEVQHTSTHEDSSVSIKWKTTSEEAGELWRIIFAGNVDVDRRAPPPSSMEVDFLQSVRVRMELTVGRDSILNLHCSSVQVLSLIHHEIILILHTAGFILAANHSAIPITEDIDAIGEPPPKQWKIEDFEESESNEIECETKKDDLGRLVRRYKLHRT